MAWITKKKIEEIKNEIKTLRSEFDGIAQCSKESAKKIQKLDKLQRIMSYSVPHKLSARIAFDMGETWLGSVTREVFLRLYKDGQEYEIRNIPELKTWLTKFKDISNPSVELGEDDLVSILFEVKDERVELVEVVANYRQGNYIFKTYERERDEQNESKKTKGTKKSE